MKRMTPRQQRLIADATDVIEFKPSTRIETLRERMDAGTFTSTGWIAPPRIDSDGWLRIGATIRDLENATPWLWADWWLARADRMLPIGWTGPTQGVLDNYAIVSRSFPISRRRETVTFSHHAVLAKLPPREQDSLLNWCSTKQRPSVSELKAEIKRRNAPKPAIDVAEPTRVVGKQPTTDDIPKPSAETVASVLASAPTPTPTPTPTPALVGDIEELIEIRVSPELHVLVKAAAAKAGMSVNDWTIQLYERETK